MSILNTSVSGMSANSNWLSSISQNIANANTTGYKNSETYFSALVDQVSNGTAAGQGVQTNTMSLNALQGSIATSQTATNLAVQGSGFFVVSDAGGDVYLTRDGSFAPDASGNLVNSDGYYLMGADLLNGGSGTSANMLSDLQKVNVVSAGLKAEATTSGSLSVNLPSTAATSSTATTEQTSLVVYDGLGSAHTIDFTFTNPGSTGSGTWTVDATDASNSGADISGGPQPLAFSTTNGALTSGSPLSLTLANGQAISLDLSQCTQLATSFSVTSATADGLAPASLSGVSIGADGTLTYNYSNGASVDAYDIPLATVESPDNLSSVSGNAYTTSAMSGQIFLGSAGSSGFGSIESSRLESSTVDLATELTNMIEAQSSYQANSKAFQTGANILDVLNNLKS